MGKFLVAMTNPDNWKNGRPSFGVWKKGDTQSFCECNKKEDAEKIVNLLNKKEKYVLTLEQESKR